MTQEEITSKDFATALECDPQKVRRWSRDIFGIDSSAGQASGKIRTYTIDQAFLLYICSVLISDRGLPIHLTREVITILEPWLRKHEYLPFQKYRSYNEKSIIINDQRLSVSGWTLIINTFKNDKICLSVESEAFSMNKSARYHYDEIIGKFEGYNAREKVVIQGEITENCEGDLIKNTIHLGLDLCVQEFQYYFGL